MDIKGDNPMRDFLIKLLGGYKAVIVVIDRRRFGTKSYSTIANFYPFVNMIYKTRSGIVSFNKDMSVNFKESL